MMDLALRLLDEEIIKQKRMLSNLYAQKNSYERSQDAPDDTASPCTPHLVNISHVCIRWRNITLNCLTLWSYICTRSLRWTGVFLARSKQTPLKIRIKAGYHGNSRWWRRFRRRLMHHGERIEELRLAIPTWDLPCQQSCISFGSGNSHLKSLEIFMMIPGLRVNPTTACAPWHSYKLASLTTLDLHSIPLDFQQHPANFLSTLKCMQDLAHLYIDDAVTTAKYFLYTHVFNTYQIRKIDLPRLSRLLIVAPISTVTALLSCVNIPVQTEMRLDCNIDRYHSLDDCTLLCSILAQRYRKELTLSVPTIRSVAIQPKWAQMVAVTLVFSTSIICDYSAYSAYFQRTHHWRVEWGCGINIPLKVIVNFPQSRDPDRSEKERIMKLGRNICLSMPVANVQSIPVGDPSNLDLWSEMLEGLPGFQRINF